MPDRSGYIGRAPGDSAVTIARQNYAPTGITTDFTFGSGYTVGLLDVYLNGVKLVESTDYTAGDGTTFSLTNYANTGDVLEGVAYKAFNVGAIANAGGNFDVANNLTVGGVANVSGNTNVTGNLNVTANTVLTGDLTVSGTMSGDGSGLTGVASTDYIITGTAATFNNNVNLNSTVGFGSVTTFDGPVALNNGGTLAGVWTGGNFSGVVTATTFLGDLTGQAQTAASATLAQGLTGTPNISVAAVTAGNGANVTGIVTATSFVGSGADLTNLNIPAGFTELDAMLFT